MKYTKEEVMQYVEEEDVRFIRLAFCDVFGVQRNVAIMPSELRRAFEYGIPIDASAIGSFGMTVKADLFLHPDPSTFCGLPWRSESGKVERMFCDISYSDGRPFEADCRRLLKETVEKAEKKGLHFDIGPAAEFYIFKAGEDGENTGIPYDTAGYMDTAPLDKGENVRREICTTLEEMGILPEYSFHEAGPGQNCIAFKYSDPLTAADNAVTFKFVVESIVAKNGLCADFGPKPLKDAPGNGLHINYSINDRKDYELLSMVNAGILEKIREMTLFLDPCEESYKRLGKMKAPGYISWSEENRSQLIRIPRSMQGVHRAELRSGDPQSNPYIAMSLLIEAGLYGVEHGLTLPEKCDVDFDEASQKELDRFERLPESLEEAKKLAAASSFIKEALPECVLNAYLRH
ncbi:MAG: glutamine synthetase [Firmicutes bacterium]|nr:glutamine synthetase [Bacillota bacterium]